MDAVDSFWEKIESYLPMEGPMAIPARFAIGAGLGWLVIAAVRPAFAYDTTNGQPRPWAPLPTLYRGSGDPTFTPWFVGPLIGGVLLSVFI